MTTNIVERVRQFSAAKQASDRDAYIALVGAIHAGKAPSEAKIADTLAACGFTLEQLEKDLIHVQRRQSVRNGLRETVAEAKKLPGLQAEARKLQEEHDKFMQAWEAKFNPVSEKMRAAADAERAIVGLRQQLHSTSQNAALTSKENDLRRVLPASLHQRINSLNSALMNGKGTFQTGTEFLKTNRKLLETCAPGTVQKRQEKEFKDHIANWPGEQVAIEAEISSIKARLEQIPNEVVEMEQDFVESLF